MKISEEAKAKARMAALLAGVVASFLLMLFGGHLIDWINDYILSLDNSPAQIEQASTD